MYENLTGSISENTLSGRKNKIMNVIEKKKKKRHIHRPLLFTGIILVIVINAAAWAAPWISGKMVRLVCRTCESGYRCSICKIWQSVFLFNRGIYDRYGNPADPCISDPEYSVDLFKKA